MILQETPKKYFNVRVNATSTEGFLSASPVVTIITDSSTSTNVHEMTA